MIAFVFFCVIAGALAQHNHTCIHNNNQKLKEDVVIGNVLKDMDSDGDGIVSVAEVTKEFVTDYDLDADGSVSEDEFVKTWHRKYHDIHDFAGYLFHHFDTDGNDKLEVADVAALEKQIDTNNDGKDSEGEFRAFMTNLYLNCVPLQHGHHAHGN